MSKKRASKTAAQLNPVTNTVQNGASVDAAPDPAESKHRPKGKKSKRDKKDEDKDKAAKAVEGDTQDKREKKDKRGKKHKKEKAAKAVKASKQDRKAKRDKPKGKKNESTPAPELRPLRKVNVLLIEPNGQPCAHFDGEIGVLELMLPKKAEGDSVA